MEKHDLETIFTSNDFINIKDTTRKGFRFRRRAYSMGVTDYFVPRRTNRPHAAPNYGPGNISMKLLIKYRHIFLQKNWLIYE